MDNSNPTPATPATPTPASTTPKAGKFSMSWRLVKAAWRGLMQDKEMSFFVILEFIVGLIILAITVYFFIFSPFRLSLSDANLEDISFQGYVVLFVLGLVIAIVSAYSEGAICSAAFERFAGGNPTISSASKVAISRFGSLFNFTFLSFTLRFFANVAEDKSDNIVAKSAAKVAKTAWSITTYFSIPAIIASPTKLGPLKAIQSSIDILKKNWGESLISNFGIYVVTSLISGIVFVLALISIGIIYLIGLPLLPGAIAVAIIFVIITILMSLISSLLNVYVKAALFYYVNNGKAPAEFGAVDLPSIFSKK